MQGFMEAPLEPRRDRTFDPQIKRLLLNGLVSPYSVSNYLSCKELDIFQLFYIFWILSIVPEFLHNSCTLPGVKNHPSTEKTIRDIGQKITETREKHQAETEKISEFKVS
jgi:hypothetical protein